MKRNSNLERNSSTSKQNQIAMEHSNADVIDVRYEGPAISDTKNIIFLMFLYLLQGIPIGLSASMPYQFQSRKISYTDQAIFSLATWPFSMKLLWAPIIDSLYWRRFGRRKSWLVPIQYLIGICMFILSYYIEDLMGSSTSKINVPVLTGIFFAFIFLAASQDVAVDGWALSLLHKSNIGWVATCNTVGQTAGYFLGNVVFLAFESKDFCNTYIRSVPQDQGLITLSGYLLFWGTIFISTTTIILFFVKEVHQLEEHEEHSIRSSYILLAKISKLPSILSLMVILLTYKIAFSPADTITPLKLIEVGLPKENLALMAVPLVPFDILLPIIISRHMSSARPLDLLIKAIPLRLVLGLFCALLVQQTQYFKLPGGGFPAYFYLILFVTSVLHQCTVFCIFVPSMAYFAKISDPSIGGTYMTFLNTIHNFGGNWPNTLFLYFVDPLTWKGCSNIENGECLSVSADILDSCSDKCTILDGYYIESIFAFFFGLGWLYFFSNRLRRIQSIPNCQWSVVLRESSLRIN